MQLTHVTRECDVVHLQVWKNLRCLERFQYVKTQACVMTYWDDQKKTLQTQKRGSSVELRQSLLSSPDYNLDPVLLPIAKPGPARKLEREL